MPLPHNFPLFIGIIMKWKSIFLFYFSLTIVTFFAYFTLENGWVNMRRGVWAFQRYDMKKSFEYFTKALKKDVCSEELCKMYAKSAIALAKEGEAINVYLNRPHHESPYDSHLVNFLIYLKRPATALEIIEKSPRPQKEDLETLYSMAARKYEEMQFFSYAEIMYKKIFENEKDVSLKTSLNYARLLHSLQKNDEAFDVYGTIIIEHPKELVPKIELTNIFLQIDRLDRAYDLLRPIPQKKLDFPTRVLFADLTWKIKGCNQAQKLYQALLLQKPNSYLVLWRLAQIAYCQNRLSLAQHYVSRIQNNHSHLDENKVFLNHYDRRTLGSLLASSDFNFQSQIAYTQDWVPIVDLAEKDADFQFFDEAIKRYVHLIEREKKNREKRILRIADLFLDKGQFSQQEKWLKKGLEYFPASEKIEKKLIEVLLVEQKNAEALSYLEKAQKKKFSYDRALMIIQAKMGEKRFNEAYQELQSLSAKKIKSKDKKAQIALYYTFLEDFVTSKKLFDQIIRKNQKNFFLHHPSVGKYYSEALLAWGDFFKAEIVLQNLYEHRMENEINERLGDLYSSQRRYVRAEKMYKSILEDPRKTHQVLRKLVVLKKEQHDDKKGLEYALALYQSDPENPEYLKSLAQAYENANFLKEAKDLYVQMLKIPSHQIIALTSLAKMHRLHPDLIKNYDSIDLQLHKALKNDPNNINLKFYTTPIERLQKDSYIDTLAINCPDRWCLDLWANVYIDNLLLEKSQRFYQEILKRDPENYTAQLKIARILGYQKHYSELLEDLSRLEKKYPENYRVLLSLARVYSWDKQYKNSERIYQKLLKIDPHNFILLLESARIQSWNHKMDKALSYYEKVYQKTIDSLFLEHLLTEPIYSLLEPEIQQWKNEKTFDSPPYYIFEKAQDWAQKSDNGPLKEMILSHRKEHFDDYEIQKAAYIERKAKLENWNRKLFASKKDLSSLMELRPHTQEARYDRSQIYCAWNLRGKTIEDFQEIVKKDPWHRMAKDNMQIEEIRSNPTALGDMRYFNEEGRGDLDRIRRTHVDAKGILTLYHQMEFSAQYRFWKERPTFFKDTLILDRKQKEEPQYFQGYFLQYQGYFSPYGSWGGYFGQKLHKDNLWKNVNLAKAWFYLRLRDVGDLSAYFERKDDLDNYFSLLQNIRTDTFEAQFLTFKMHRFDFQLRMGNINYSDDAQEFYSFVDFNLKLLDNPHLLRLNLRGEFRNNNATNMYIYSGPYLVNIIHPYWTPKNYKGLHVGMKWEQNLASDQSCSALKHYYSIELAGGTDSEKNNFISCEAKWSYELSAYLSFEIFGSIYRSRLWDSEELLANFKIHF
jgi:tetratricopeptide (TPR) repeat protein